MFSCNCIACGGACFPAILSVYDSRFGIDSPYNIVRCCDCELLQTSPRPTEVDLKALYERHYNFGGESGTTYTNLRQWLYSSWLYRVWLLFDGDISFHLRVGRGRLLDIGCNEGRGLEFFRQRGYVAEGLEMNANAAAVAKSKGFVVHTERIEEFNSAEKFDVVVMSNVLEHSLNPVEMLRGARGVVSDDGEVWISCPNSRSLLRWFFGSYWINWHVPFHLVHFSPVSLNDCLTKAGFTVSNIKFESPSLWVTHSILTRLYFSRGKVNKLLRNHLVVGLAIISVRLLLFPFLFILNRFGLGDCLVVTCKPLRS